MIIMSFIIRPIVVHTSPENSIFYFKSLWLRFCVLYQNVFIKLIVNLYRALEGQALVINPIEPYN